MRTHRLVFLASVLCATLALAPRPVAGHPETAPTLTNRYLTLAALGADLELSLSWLFGNLPAHEQRRTFDEDGDGRISESELKRARAGLSARAPQLFRCAVDGKPQAFTEPRVTVDLGGEDRVVAAPLVVEWLARMTVTRARHAIQVTAAAPPARLGETELAVVLGPDWHLRESFHDGGPTGTATSFKVTGPMAIDGDGGTREAQSTFTLEPRGDSGPVRDARPGGPSRALIGVIAAGALASLAVLARMRARRTPPHA